MLNSISPNSVWHTGNESLESSFTFMNGKNFRTDEALSPRSRHCKFCNDALFNIASNWSENYGSVNSPREPKEGCQSKLYLMSENIFGLFCSETVDHSMQLENIYSAISQVKRNKDECKIKIFCMNKVCPAISQLCEESLTITFDLYKPPHLKPIFKFCQSICNWLSMAKNNIAFLYSNTDETLFLTMAYTYSNYYDSFPGRDLAQSAKIKSFIKLHSKAMDKVPVSYRRYAGYMGIYSASDQLDKYQTSVTLYCLILYDFPAMESNKHKTSQLFLKIYTSDPLRCSHTTKLYRLSSNVSRLVILFDQYPILLRNDTMIVCYHKSIVGSRRIKLFRLNFHTCQATGEMLSFISHDFEDLYPACPFKMKLDLYFQETAVFGQGDSCSVDNTSPLERVDSYQSLSDYQCGRPHSSLSLPTIKNVSSITILKTSVNDHKDDMVIKDREHTESTTQKSDVINNSGRITGPVDSHHSTKLESVRTSSNLLNGTGQKPFDMTDRQHFSTFNSNFYGRERSTEGEKCSKQLDTLMHDLNLSNMNPSMTSYQHNNITSANSNNQREVQLMSELLEAQKEISNLRRSMNNLDMIDHSRGINQASRTNAFTSRSQGLTSGNITGSMPDTHSIDGSRSRMWLSTQKENHLSSCQNDSILPQKDQYIQQSYHKQDFHSLDGRATPSTYSAHRENMERERTMKDKYLTIDKISNHKHNVAESTDVLEEIETINLQPIGKGIQDLTKGNGQIKLSRAITPGGLYRAEHSSHGFIDNIGSLSPTPMKQKFNVSRSNFGSFNRIQNDVCSPTCTSPTGFFNDNQQNTTLQCVEDKVQWWYQPNISRDEAIVILKPCSPGSFLIRDSTTYAGAYGLAVKVAAIPPKIMPKSDDLEAEKVRHYLIEPMGNQGVCFKGFPEEPVFPSLTNLVLYYTHTASVLPCLLVLPDRPLHETPKLTMKVTSDNSVVISSPKLQSEFTNNRNGFSVYYLGCYDVEYITGPSVVNKAIERLLTDLDARKFTECQLRINPGDGIVLTDMERKLFFRRHHAFSNIGFCALDPRDRKIELDVCKSKGVRKTKLFGIIVKNYVAGESKCFLFGELDPNQKANSIVKSVNANLQLSMQN